MPTTADLTRRLDRLGPAQAARSVCVITHGHSDEEIDQALAQHCLSRSDPDIKVTVLNIRIVEPDGSIAPPEGDIQISVTDNN